MVYTLALQLKELIAEMLVKRKERIAREDEERYRREEEVSRRLATSALDDEALLSSRRAAVRGSTSLTPHCHARRPSQPRSAARP